MYCAQWTHQDTNEWKCKDHMRKFFLDTIVLDTSPHSCLWMLVTLKELSSMYPPRSLNTTNCIPHTQQHYATISQDNGHHHDTKRDPQHIPSEVCDVVMLVDELLQWIMRYLAYCMHAHEGEATMESNREWRTCQRASRHWWQCDRISTTKMKKIMWATQIENEYSKRLKTYHGRRVNQKFVCFISQTTTLPTQTTRPS